MIVVISNRNLKHQLSGNSPKVIPIGVLGSDMSTNGNIC